MSMKTVAILILNESCSCSEFQSSAIVDFFKSELKQLEFDTKKVTILKGNGNIIKYEIDFMLKHYDIVLITGGLKSGILNETIGKFVAQHQLPCKAVEINEKYTEGIITKSSKFNDISISRLGNEYSLIYFQRIFIICCEDYQNVFKGFLRAHLQQYHKEATFKKLYKIVVNGNRNFDYIENLKECEGVAVDYECADHVLTVEIVSSKFGKFIEVEKKFRNSINFDRVNMDYFIPWEEIYGCEDLYVQNALKDIEESLARYGPSNIFLCFNGGKDCTVLLHLISAVLKHSYPSFNQPLLCMYVQSECPFDEQNEFIQMCKIYYNLNIITFVTSIKHALRDILSNYPNLKACLMGTRRTDPFSSNLETFSMTDPDWPQVMRVSPLLDWHYSDIWDYILYFKVPYCVLYDMGYTSLGSKNDTIKNPSLKYHNVIEDKEMYLPAYKLLKETKERNGRNGTR